MDDAFPTSVSQDLIDDVLKAGAVSSGRRIDGKEHARLKTMATAIRTVPELEPVLEEILPLIQSHPQDERLQRCVAVALGRVQDPRARSVWRGIDRRFPDSDTAPLRVARDTYKNQGPEAGAAYIRQRFVNASESSAHRFVLARAYLETRQDDLAEDILREIIEAPDVTSVVLVKTTQLLIKQGQLSDAENAAQALISRFGEEPEHLRLLQEVEHIRSLTEHRGERSAASTILASAIDKIIDSGRKARVREPEARTPSSLGPVVMIGGSLAPGGAERQFTVTALGLHEVLQAGATINGVSIEGPLTLITRSVHSRKDDDFYVPRLREAGLRVYEYATFEPYGGRARRSLSRTVHPLLPFLPNHMHEGITHLADVLRYLSPEVVHIWQDGSILATGAAAILAGVPRIVLGARTMPPTDRHDREKPEYYPTFRGLLREPGVSLVSNSRLVARRYAEWLEIDRRKVGVIPNGIATPDLAPTSQSLELAKALPPPGGRFVVGAVMRMAEVKRPLLWVDCAAAIAAKCPEAFFVMIGRGPLLDAAIERARALGIGERVIFTGATPDVGFWYSQMDVLLLLSRYEGLPNVLIEAQMCGVPVVTTPAGGSAETLDPGRTGTVLDSIDIDDPDMVADAVLAWRRTGDARRELAESLRQRASSEFSVERMLELTVQTYMN